MKEVWKDVKGYEGLYQVSNFGRIKSMPKSNRLRTIIMKPKNRKDGYLTVALFSGNKYNHLYVHRIVAEAFILNECGGKEINHIDGNKKNNNVCNLEWVTRKQNLEHAVKNGLRDPAPMKGKTGEKCKTSKYISQYDLSGNLIKNWIGIAEAARHLKCNACSISACLTNRTKTCKGFVWKYTVDKSS